MTLQAAVEELADRCDAREEPTLSDPELTDLLTAQRYVSLFAPSTACGRGQLILPSTADLYAAGPAYAVLVPGVTSSEPTWPTAPGTIAYSGNVQLVWWGVYDGAPWDRTEAVRQALKLKIARCAKLYDMGDRDSKLSMSQMRQGYESALKLLGPSSRGWA